MLPTTPTSLQLIFSLGNCSQPCLTALLMTWVIQNLPYHPSSSESSLQFGKEVRLIWQHMEGVDSGLLYLLNLRELSKTTQRLMEQQPRNQPQSIAKDIFCFCLHSGNGRTVLILPAPGECCHATTPVMMIDGIATSIAMYAKFIINFFVPFLQFVFLTFKFVYPALAGNPLPALAFLSYLSIHCVFLSMYKSTCIILQDSNNLFFYANAINISCSSLQCLQMSVDIFKCLYLIELHNSV